MRINYFRKLLPQPCYGKFQPLLPSGINIHKIFPEKLSVVNPFFGQKLTVIEFIGEDGTWNLFWLFGNPNHLSWLQGTLAFVVDQNQASMLSPALVALYSNDFNEIFSGIGFGYIKALHFSKVGALLVPWHYALAQGRCC